MQSMHKFYINYYSRISTCVSIECTIMNVEEDFSSALSIFGVISFIKNATA